MLILTRKIDEEIVINSDIKLRILTIANNKIKIGIEAPKDIKILRGELFELIKSETLEALNKSSENIKNVSNFKVNKLNSF